MVHDSDPHIIDITESWANKDITDAELGLEDYVMFRKDRMGRRGGGVLLYVKDTIPAYEIQLREEADCEEAIWCKLITGHKTGTMGVMYRCPNITKECNENIQNAIREVSKGECNIKIKSDKTTVSRCKRNFRKGNYNEMRTTLAHIDWNDKMKNRTGAESWNILKSELDSVINRYVPMKKQGKRPKKKHLSKEAYKDMWRLYKHTRKDKDYEVYKEALNATTNEVRKSKRNFEPKLAQNIKSDSKSSYAYVRSKQNVRDKVGPLEDNAGNTITQGVLMADELNMYFSAVFTREEHVLHVPETI